MSNDSEDSPEVSHVLVLNEKGERVCIIELPLGTTPEELEFVARSSDGTRTFIPQSSSLAVGGRLPLTKTNPLSNYKAAKESYIGNLVLPLLRVMHNLDEQSYIQHNPKDPPDLLLKTPTGEFGIELCELIYPERYLNDNLLARFESALRSHLPPGEFDEHSIHFMFKMDPDGRLLLPKRALMKTVIVDLIDRIRLSKMMACVKGVTSVVPEENLPESCRPFLHSILVDYIGPVSDSTAQCPSIRFGNHQQDFSAETLKEIVRGTVQRKLDMRLSGNNILIVWSQHPSFTLCFTEMCSAIARLLLERMTSPFIDVLYTHYSSDHHTAIILWNHKILTHTRGDKAG